MAWADRYDEGADHARAWAKRAEGSQRQSWLNIAEAYEQLAREARERREVTRALRKRSPDLPYLRPDIDS